MQLRQHLRQTRSVMAGFTLIELMITVAIVAVLASLAYPSFMGAIRKSRRSEAFDMTTRIQQAEEKWRANNPAYTASLGALGESAISATTEHGYYQFQVEVAPDPDAGSTYIITATAQGSQAADNQCLTMTAQVAGGKVTYSPDICWAK